MNQPIYNVMNTVTGIFGHAIPQTLLYVTIWLCIPLLPV